MHVAAPIAFLLAVTIAVLLIRTGLEGSHSSAHGNALGPVAKPTGGLTQAGARRRARTRRRAGAGSAIYVVQTGDTFGSIAVRTRTSVSALERLNPGVSPTALQVGQRIRVK